MTRLTIVLLVSIVLLVLVLLLGMTRTGVRRRSVTDRQRPEVPVVVADPWSRHLAAAERADQRARRTMRGSRTSTNNDRLGLIHERLDQAIGMIRELASRGEEIDRRIGSLAPASLRTRLATFHEQALTDASPELTAAIAAVERQIETADRLRVHSNMTAIGLVRAIDRLDRLATRVEESRLDALQPLLHDLDALIDELVQVRASIDGTATSGPDAAAGSTGE